MNISPVSPLYADGQACAQNPRDGTRALAFGRGHRDFARTLNRRLSENCMNLFRSVKLTQCRHRKMYEGIKFGRAFRRRRTAPTLPPRPPGRHVPLQQTSELCLLC
jgi:hypothetical protein